MLCMKYFNSMCIVIVVYCAGRTYDNKSVNLIWTDILEMVTHAVFLDTYDVSVSLPMYR